MTDKELEQAIEKELGFRLAFTEEGPVIVWGHGGASPVSPEFPIMWQSLLSARREVEELKGKLERESKATIFQLKRADALEDELIDLRDRANKWWSEMTVRGQEVSRLKGIELKLRAAYAAMLHIESGCNLSQHLENCDECRRIVTDAKEAK